MHVEKLNDSINYEGKFTSDKNDAGKVTKANREKAGYNLKKLKPACSMKFELISLDEETSCFFYI